MDSVDCLLQIENVALLTNRSTKWQWLNQQVLPTKC